MAAELAYTGLKVCVLESGTDKRSNFADGLKEVESERLLIKDNSRERIVGGAGTVWGGLSAPLDTIDLEQWPIQGEEIARYVEEASRYRFPITADFEAPRGWELSGLADKVFVAVRPPYNFATLRSVFEREGVDLVMDATVTGFVHEAGMVHQAVCRASDMREVRVTAQVFVLAMGGIETPRLMLAANIGNEHDQVGRYFMNHPKGYAGRLRLNAPLPASSPYLPRTDGSRMVYAGLRLSEEVQKEQGLLNSCVQFEPDLGLMQRYAYGLWRRLPPALSRLFLILRPRTLRARWFADMEPLPDNRVMLSKRKDVFGVPLAKVSYALSPRDEASLRALHAQIKAGVAAAGLGTLIGGADEVVAVVRQDASHHLGGTRIGHDPSTSVVDTDCKVHSLSNMYVAGGSVFPSGGCANPTMTIVALAIRLANHIATKLAPDTAVRGALEAAGPGSIPRPLVSGAACSIIVIGAGKRVREDVVPALESLGEIFEIHGIYAQHAGEVVGSRGRYEVKKLDALDARHIRFAYVAVPRESVLGVLRQLPAHMEIIVDTPVPYGREAQKEFARFKRVHVAEDSVCMPWLKEYEGRSIKTILAEHALYRYHGIALVKKLCGSIHFAFRLGNMIYLRAGRTWVRIVEPRDYARGKLYINGKEAEGVVQRMNEYKRMGLARMLGSIAKGDEPWTLAQGQDDARIDQRVHRYRLYVG